MNTNGMSQIGIFTPDNLIAGNRYPVDVCHVIIKAGQKLERGTVLEEDIAEPGKYVIRGTMAAGTSNPAEDQEQKHEKSGKEVEAEYILAEDTDASEGDVVAAAFNTGEFAENALIVKEGYTITDNDRKTLRNAGIFLRTIMM